MLASPRMCGATFSISRTASSAVRIDWLRTSPLGPGTSAGVSAERPNTLVKNNTASSTVCQGCARLTWSMPHTGVGAAARPFSNSSTQRGVADPVHLGAVGCDGGAKRLFSGIGSAVGDRRHQFGRTARGGDGVGHLQADGRDVRNLVARLLFVEHDAGVARRPQRHRLGAMPTTRREADLGQQHLDLAGVLGLDFDEVEPGRRLGLGEGGQVATPALGRERGGSVLQPQQ